MAQNIILKRSAVPGRVPDTGSINLGEVAINTHDGKLYFKKSGSVESVETIVTTDSITSGSLFISDDITIQQDLYVIRDVITDGDIDAGGALSGSGLSINDTLQITHNNFQLSGSTAITGSLTVLGEINARQFNISIISSSVIFESGSSKFGNTSDDIHSFTGSVEVTGSFYLNGTDLSQGNNSGSFSGSFQGDGSGLRGVVSDDIPRDGWDYNSNSSASISEFNVTSSKYLIDFQWEQEVGSPIGYKGFLANTTGSSQIVPTTEGIKFIVGNQLVATVGAEGITATIPSGVVSSSAQIETLGFITSSTTTLPNGVVSSSAQLTSSYDSRYVLSGSITQTTWDNIASKPLGIYSSSTQLPLGIISGSTQITALGYATTGSNTFVGTQTMSGSIIPATDNAYDLGSATYQWRDIYVSSGSLYIDGTKVLSSTGNELQITTDAGQSIKILEAGSDSIILQSADGDIQLKSSGGGNLLFDPTSGLIDVRGTLQIQNGNKITSSDGNAIQFGNNIAITGSIVSTTTPLVSGSSQIDLTQTTGYSTFSTSVNSRVVNFENNSGTYATTSSVNTISASAWGAFQSASTYSGSFYTTINTNIGNINRNSASAWGAFQSASTYSASAAAIFATTGSNTFIGTQTITGSLFISSNLIVQGSSSLQNITASAVSIGTNIVNLNTATPAIRYAGLVIGDSGSVGGSGSFLYDSVQDEMIFVHRGNSNVVTSSVVLMGPQTYDAVGTEIYPTINRIQKGTGNEHLGDSNISDDGTKVTITNGLDITGALSASTITGFGNVTTYSSSVDSRIITNLNSAAGAFASASSYSGSLATSISASKAEYTSYSASAAVIDNTQTTNITAASASAWGAFQSASSYSSSFGSRISTIEGKTLVSGSSQITLSSTTGGGTSAAVQFGSLGIGTGASTLPLNVYTSSANANNVIAEFYNGDYTAGTKNFVRVRNNVSLGSSMSSYFGQGQDNNTYIVSNDFARGGDIVISGNTGDVTFGGNVIPKTNNSKDLGSATYGWRNIYTNDLHLSNEGKPEGNDVDGTTGNWTIQEGAEHLYIINNKTGKKFKFSLEEIQ